LGWKFNIAAILTELTSTEQNVSWKPQRCCFSTNFRESRHGPQQSGVNVGINGAQWNESSVANFNEWESTATATTTREAVRW
jgi:hypothetical protein